MAKRLLSALVGVIVGVSIIAIDNKWLYTAAIIFFGVVGTFEFIRAVKCTEYKLLTVVSLIVAAAIPPILIFGLNWLILPVFAGYVMSLFGIMLTKHKRIKVEHIAMCGGAATLIPAALSAIIMFRFTASETDYAMGVFLIVYLLFCAWLGDSGAFFVGTFLGKHKLCPEVSPKKTIEGFVGGIVTVGVGVFLEALVFNLFIFKDVQINYPVVIIIGMVASVLGVLGDLSASVIKREYGVKDFGNIMPGHGGVLDRFDSVLFVAPFILIIYQYFSPIVV